MNSSSWLRFRVPLGFALALWYFVVARPRLTPILYVAFAFVMAGCLLRSWAAGYLLKGKRVAVGGPYAYVRNPLYVGSFLIGGGFCLALAQDPLPLSAILFWIVFLVGFLGIYPAKVRSEEAECRHSMGQAFESYRQKVPAFVPTRGRVAGLGYQDFSRELYRRNREYQCVLGVIAGALFLAIKAHYAG